MIQPLALPKPKRRTLPLLPPGMCPCPRCGVAIALPVNTAEPRLLCSLCRWEKERER